MLRFLIVIFLMTIIILMSSSATYCADNMSSAATPTPVGGFGPRQGVGMRVSRSLDNQQCAAILGHQCTNNVHRGWAVQTVEAQRKWTPTPTSTPVPTQTPHVIYQTDIIFLPATMTPGPTPTARIVQQLQIRTVIATPTPTPIPIQPEPEQKNGGNNLMPILVGGGALYGLIRGNRKKNKGDDNGTAVV